MKTSHRSMEKSLVLRWLMVALAFAAAVAGIYLGVRFFDHSDDAETFGSLEGRFEEAPSITYQGKQYVQNTRINSYLFMGVDHDSAAQSEQNDHRNGGQSDFLMLVAIDSEHKTVKRIQIDRDTMAEITVLGVLGNDLGTSTMQICLSHGFGDGKEQSCQFTVEAVRRLLYGIDIDGYFTLSLDGITTLNDLLGGVTVTIEDDFSKADATLAMGSTVTLRGTQAESYVRGRMNVGDGTNASRMRRQKQYLSKAMDMVFAKTQDDAGFFGMLLDGLKPYTITDMTRGKMINEANKANKYTVEPIVTPAGEHMIGSSGFMEFHADEDALIQLVLEAFYDLKEQ